MPSTIDRSAVNAMPYPNPMRGEDAYFSVANCARSRATLTGLMVVNADPIVPGIVNVSKTLRMAVV